MLDYTACEYEHAESRNDFQREQPHLSNVDAYDING